MIGLRNAAEIVITMSHGDATGAGGALSAMSAAIAEDADVAATTMHRATVFLMITHSPQFRLPQLSGVFF
jgi:preprotein translocase subunit SecG